MILFDRIAIVLDLLNGFIPTIDKPIKLEGLRVVRILRHHLRMMLY